MGLISWARVLGLTVLAAGKSSEYDFIFDPAKGTVTSNRVAVQVAGLEELWHLGQRPAAEVARERSELLDGLPQRAVPDLCEMGLVANATGFKPDRPWLHAPVARTMEIPDLLSPSSQGGLLEGEEVLDIVNCLRRPDEASLGGGVFIVVRAEDEATWRVLEAKGHPLDRSGRYALLYHPAHLLGVETPLSVLAAALLGQPTGGERPRPVCDLVGRAGQDLPAGTVLTMGGHHHLIKGVEAELVQGAPVRGNNPIPFYLMANRRLKEDVRAGELITADKVEQAEDSVLARLRADQDRRFF
jgi:predicted homoserine dehydrogenase-like protein